MYPIPYVFTESAAIAAADPVWEFNAPQGLTLVGVSLCGQTFTGSPSSWNIDIVDDGVDALAGVAVHATAGTPAVWKSKHLGGTADPVYIAPGSVVGITLNVTGGTSPTIAKLAVIVWALPGVV